MPYIILPIFAILLAQLGFFLLVLWGRTYKSDGTRTTVKEMYFGNDGYGLYGSIICSMAAALAAIVAVPQG